MWVSRPVRLLMSREPPYLLYNTPGGPPQLWKHVVVAAWKHSRTWRRFAGNVVRLEGRLDDQHVQKDGKAQVGLNGSRWRQHGSSRAEERWAHGMLRGRR